jgi:hypothetical protein
MTDVATINNELKSLPSGAPPGNQAAWVKQFESAQWQQRLRYQPSNGQQQDAELPGREGGNGEASKARTVGQVTQGRDRNSNSVSSEATNIQSSRQSVHAETSSTGMRETALKPSFTLAPAAQERPATLPIERHEMRSFQLRRYANELWQAQHAHAMLDAEGVKLWLRDARYRSNDGPRILQSLREHFARLGIRLTQFTLNGTAILKTDGDE